MRFMRNVLLGEEMTGAQVILITLAGLPCALTVILLSRRVSFRKRGWRIRGHGRDAMEYEEWDRGTFVFGAELMGRGPITRVVQIPSPEKWDDMLPDWAAGRRAEIVRRIKTFLPESKTRYENKEEGQTKKRDMHLILGLHPYRKPLM